MSARRVLLLLVWLAVASTAFGQVSITSPASLPQGFSEIPYTYTFTAFVLPANAPVTWALTPNPLSNFPVGFSLSPNGTLSGTTTQSGTFTFVVTATSGAFTSTETFSLVLLNPFITILTPPNLGNAFVGQSYSLLLSANSNPSGLVWTLAPGSQLPPGLSLSTSGTISGRPTAAGTYDFQLNVQISTTTIVVNQNFRLMVYAGQTTIQTTTLPLATLAQPYSTTIAGGPAGITWTLTGLLPPGIFFNQNTGLLAGTTTETITIVGVYPIQVQANYPNYLSATRNLTLYLTNGPLSVPQPNLSPAVQNSAYTTTVSAAGGLAPYQWSFASANTQGLSINPVTGVIAGTPQTSGNFMLPVILSDVTGASITVNLNLFVASPLSVSTATLPNGSVGAAYSQPLLSGGGVSPFTWSLVSGSGSLPPGLTLSSSGVVSGMATAAGTFHFTVQVTDSGGRTATRALTISMSVAPVAITTSSLPNGQITVPYSQTLAASGGVAPYTWSLVSGAFPGGLSMNANGVVSGIPSGPLGITSFTVQVTDSSPPPALTVQKAFTINIALTLTITTIGPLPGGVVNVPYSQTLAGSGGTPPYVWSITSGALPAGLTLNPSAGVISGTPTATGPNLFMVTLTDSAGLAAQQQLNITVVATPSITTTGNLSASVGTTFSQTLTATGGTPPYTWSISSGTLPAGLQLSGGVISGTPTAAGTSNVTLKVTDSQGLTGTAAIAIAVALPATPALTIGTIPGIAATQPLVTLSLASPYPAALTGTLSVSFQSAAGGNPTEVKFFTTAGGFTTLSFNIPAGATAAAFPNPPVLATGTAAGTITLSATLSAAGVDVTPNPAPTETIAIAPSAPVITQVTFSNTSGSLAVTVTGYSTTREMVSGQFIFAPATGSTLSQSEVTVQLASAYSTWYQSSASNQYGGQFLLTVPFTVSGTAAGVASVSVTLTNTIGTSAAATPQ